MSIIEKAVNTIEGGTSPDSSGDVRPGLNGGYGPSGRSRGQQVSYQAVKLDQIGLKSHGVDWDGTSQTQQEFKQIKRPLLNNLLSNKFDKDALGSNFMVVTSAVPGEGKTHTSLNLAMSLTLEKDYDVLFVDGDTIKRDASLVLGLGDRKGLNDLLSDPNASTDSYILQSDISNLKVLPAGTFSDSSCELLSSNRMQVILKRLLKPKGRIVVFDAPPMLATVEASVLVQMAGQVVIVTEAAKTSQSMMEAVLDQIQSDKPVGLVLNKSRKEHGQYDYSAYYGYYKQ